jgi:hypothetical protein
MLIDASGARIERGRRIDMSIHTHDHQAVGETRAWRERFAVGQVLSLAIGIFWVVIGAVGLARGGMGSWTTPTVEVAGIGMTPLLAGIHLLLGLVGMAGAGSPASARGAMMFLGPVFIAAGIIALIQSVDVLAWTEVNGIAYIIAGAAATLGAMAMPVAAVEERVVTHT